MDTYSLSVYCHWRFTHCSFAIISPRKHSRWPGSERFSFQMSSNMCCLSQHYAIELSRPWTVISRIRYRQSQADNEHLCLSPAKRSNVTELLALNFLSLSSFSSYCNDENSRASLHCDGIGQAMLEKWASCLELVLGPEDTVLRLDMYRFSVSGSTQ